VFVRKVALTVENSHFIGPKVACATIIGRFGLGDDDDENRSQASQSDAPDSPSSYLSAADIPLPDDVMQSEPEPHGRLDVIEGELTAQRLSLENIRDQLGQLLHRLNTPTPLVNPAPNPIPPPITSHTSSTNSGSHRLKPASPSEFFGERSKGRAFLNSCDLYIGLAPTQFADDSSKIYWVLSFMKGDRAARYTDRTMRSVQATGSLPFATWAAFRDEFVREFCPKNEVQSSRTELETSKYHQGSRSVDEYVDEFRELVDRAKYTEGANIVLKFRHGLQQSIQNYIACLTYGRPSDDSPQEWYDAAILCDENRIANSAFQSTFRNTRTTTSLIATPPRSSIPSGSTSFRPSFAQPSSSFAPKASRDPDAMDVDATRKRGLTPMFCYRCGKTGHLRPDCPQRFDVRTMSHDERSDFVQHELVALDVRATTETTDAIAEAPDGDEDVEEEVATGKKSDFISRNE
jgi:hypothetical protein